MFRRRLIPTFILAAFIFAFVWFAIPHSKDESALLSQTAEATEPNPRERPHLVVSVENTADSSVNIGDTQPVTITIENTGTRSATNVVIHIQQNVVFGSASVVVGDLDIDSSITTILSLPVIGYQGNRQALIIDVSSSSLVNIVQATGYLTFTQRNTTTLGTSPRLTLVNNDPVSELGIQTRLLSERRIERGAFQGKVLAFSLSITDTNATLTQAMEINIDSLIGISVTQVPTLTMVYRPIDADSQVVTMTYDSATNIGSFTPIGEGEYEVRTAVEDPAGWVPAFIEPVVSLFNGSVSYSYNFLVPPGPGGLQPALGLAYNSAASYGASGKRQSDPAGWGWNLIGEIDIVQDMVVDDQDTGDMKVYGSYRLSLNGVGYELVPHAPGTGGETDRYRTVGNLGIYAEYCRFGTTYTYDYTPFETVTRGENASQACRDADNLSDEPNGDTDQIGDTVNQGNPYFVKDYHKSQGFWIVIMPNGTQYRLGYTHESEQEISIPTVGSIDDADEQAAMKWRVDRAVDVHGNEITYRYEEHWDYKAGNGGIDSYPHKVRSSYLTTMTYGIIDEHVIVLNYGKLTDIPNTTDEEILGNQYGITWQTHYLESVQVFADNQPQPIRTYQLNQVVAVQTDDAQVSTGWKFMRLDSILELNAANENILGESGAGATPAVSFTYVMLKTGTAPKTNTPNDHATLFPYLEEVRTPVNPLPLNNGINDPIVVFKYYGGQTYYDDKGVSEAEQADGFPADALFNPIKRKIVRSGWGGELLVIDYDYGGLCPGNCGYGAVGPVVKKSSGSSSVIYSGRFQGFYNVKETYQNTFDENPPIDDIYRQMETKFYGGVDDSETSSIVGKTEESIVKDADGTVLSKVTNSWEPHVYKVSISGVDVDVDGLFYATLDEVVTWTKAGNVEIKAATKYEYNGFGDQIRVEEYLKWDDADPYRTIVTGYLYRNSVYSTGGTSKYWFRGLPFRHAVYEGEYDLDAPNPEASRVSKRITLYDGMDCDDDSSGATPGNTAQLGKGQVEETAVWIGGAKGNGSSNCNDDYVVTTYHYGENGDGAGQLSRVVSPNGSESISIWMDDTLVEQTKIIADGEIYTTYYQYYDANTPWLLTRTTPPNGLDTLYSYDLFGRLIQSQRVLAMHPPSWVGNSGGNGYANVPIYYQTMLEIDYTDNQSPMYIDKTANPGDPVNEKSARTFYNGLGMPIQTTSWVIKDGNQDDRNFVQTRYNGLGQVICTTLPQAHQLDNGLIKLKDQICNKNTPSSFAINLATQTAYSASGQAIKSIAPGQPAGGEVASYSAVVGRFNFSVDPLGHLTASRMDGLGRLDYVEQHITDFEVPSDIVSGTNWSGLVFDSTQPDPNVLVSEITTDYVNGTPALRLEVPSGKGWIRAVKRSASNTLEVGEAASIRFLLSTENFEGIIGFGTSSSSTTDYAGFHIWGDAAPASFPDNTIMPQIHKGTTDTFPPTLSINIDQKTNVWYRAEFVYAKTDEMYIRIWQETMPENGIAYIHNGQNFGGAPLNFVFEMTEGTVILAEYQEGAWDRTTYSYDAMDNLTKVVDSQGNETTMTYDSLGRKTSMKDPDMGIWVDSSAASKTLEDPSRGVWESNSSAYTTWDYSYDISGNLMQQTDPRGNTICFYYDGMNRMTDKTYNGASTYNCASPTSASESLLAHYSFYTTGLSQLGQLAESVGYSNGIVVTDTYTYDIEGRPAYQNRQIDDGIQPDPVQSYAMSTNYDVLDRVSSLVYPDGEFVTYGYDRDGIDTLTAGNQLLVNSIDHNRFGQMTSLKRTNSVWSTYSYAASGADFGRLENFTLKKNSDSLTYQNIDYTYDLVGNILAIDDSGKLDNTLPENGEESFAYDSLNRMVQADGDGNNSPSLIDYGLDYEYDELGRIVNRDDGNDKMHHLYYGSHPHAVTERFNEAYSSETVTLKVTRPACTSCSSGEDFITLHVNDLPLATFSLNESDGSEETISQPLNLSGDDVFYLLVHGNTGNNIQINDIIIGGQSYKLDKWVSGTNPGPADGNVPLHGSYIMVTGGASQYRYDENGNMHTRQDVNETYKQTFDVENRLISVFEVHSGLLTEFAYDGSGQRIYTKANSDEITHYPYAVYQVTNPHVTDPLEKSTYMLGAKPIAQRGSEGTAALVSFEEQNSQGLLGVAGTWNVITSTQGTGNNIYRQSDTAQAEARSTLPLPQDSAMSYEWTMEFVSGQLRAGMRIFGQEAPEEAPDGGYMIQQKADSLELKERTGSTLQVRATTNLTATTGVSYTYKTEYFPETGLIEVYRDDVLALSWTDPTPTLSGASITLNTGNSDVIFHRLSVNQLAQDLQYFHGDHLGSVNFMTYGSTYGNDKKGDVMEGTIQHFLPFGEMRGTPGGALNTEHGFTGHLENRSVGLTYMNARYYVPALNQFLTADTIIPDPSNPQNYNRYAYVLNNPIGYKDPSGHNRCGVVGTLCPDAKVSAIRSEYRKMIKNARALGVDVAADNLERFIEGSGGTKNESVEWLRGFSPITKAEGVNQKRFESTLTDLAYDLADGETKDLSEYWDRMLTGSVFSELFYASGTSTITSEGEFTLTRDGNVVSISGSVTHNWHDPYDWHAGLTAFIPGSGVVSDEDAIFLEQYGGANLFEMEAVWTQTLEAEIVIRRLWFDTTDFKWSIIE